LSILVCTLAVLFLILILSYIWARLFFFTINSKKTRILSIFYDLVVAAHVYFTFQELLSSKAETDSLVIFSVGIFTYLSSLLFFWWSLKSVRNLEFAMGDNVKTIITNGPFRIVRHPFYTSYLVTWFTGSFMFNSLPLWITLALVGSFYITSAVTEEKSLLESDLGQSYLEYRKQVGMFFPKATQWKSWFSELYPRQTK